MPKGADLAKPDKSREPSKVPAVASWIQALEVESTLRTEQDDFDPDEVIGRILTANTWEDALAVQESGLPSGQDLKDKPLMIKDFEVSESEKEAGLPFFMFVEATNLETGEEIQFSVGAGNVMAMLWQARQFGRLPGQFVIKGKTTKKKNEVLFLIPHKTTTVKG